MCQLHISLIRAAQIYLELHFCVELHTKKALLPKVIQTRSKFWKSWLDKRKTEMSREAQLKELKLFVLCCVEIRKYARKGETELVGKL